MSLKHAILGFLSFKSLSGYDLKKAFDRSVRHFWPANQSQIYRTLAELDEQGWVEKEVIAREERLDMKVYSITSVGREELQRWLAMPLPPQDTREPLLIQVYFGGQLSDAELLNLLRHELAATEERIQIFSAIYAHSTTQALPPGVDARAMFLSLLTLEYGLAGQGALRRWLTAAIERLQSATYISAELTQLIGETHDQNHS